MKGVPVDVIQFVEWRFATRDLKSVLLLLDQSLDLSIRLLRSSLYLSDGSLTLLQYHLQAARSDPQGVLLAAEYISGSGTEPLLARDMSQPFLSRENLGPDRLQTRAARTSWAHPKATPRRTVPTRATSFHEALTLRKFLLGKVSYVVMSTQTSRKYVRCYRIEDKVASLVNLPLEFVLEQTAEEIELEVAYN